MEIGSGGIGGNGGMLGNPGIVMLGIVNVHAISVSFIPRMRSWIQRHQRLYKSAL